MNKISKKVMKNFTWLTAGLFLIIFFSGQLGNGEFFGVKTAFGYGGGWVRPAITPEVTAINYPLTILSSQEGNATSNFGQQATVTLHVPKGAVVKETTFRIQMSAANTNQKPDTTGGVYMIGDKIFSITATNISNNPVTEFNKSLTITIELPEMPGDISKLGVYYLDSETNKWIAISDAKIDPATGIAEFKVNHLTTFSVINGGTDSIAIVKEPKKNVKAKNNSNSENVAVLGVEHYADGTLIRCKDMKIYIIINEKLKHIINLKQLEKYAGQTIFDVDDETLGQYNGVAVLGVEGYGDGALIRGNNGKIYVIKNKVKQYIKNLKELKKYSGQAINNVDDSVLESFENIE